MRLTRNLDKDRGFVNGAIGVIEVVLDSIHGVFLLRLTTGNLVLVHPIVTDGVVHLPCAYGYATTIRRAQGSTLDAGCLFFDHCYPPERGYAYVGVSRFRTRDGVYHYGRIRRSDWLPVGGDPAEEQVSRSIDSEDDEYAEEIDEAEMLYGDSESDEDLWLRGAEDEDSDDDASEAPDYELGSLAGLAGGVSDLDGLGV